MSSQEELLPEPKIGVVEKISRASTRVVTALTTLVGLGLGVNELVIRPETQAARLMFAAFIVSGAQGFDGVMKYFIDRAFGEKEKTK